MIESCFLSLPYSILRTVAINWWSRAASARRRLRTKYFLVDVDVMQVDRMKDNQMAASLQQVKDNVQSWDSAKCPPVK